MRNVYTCSVPFCGRKMSDRSLIFHTFPSRPELREQWIQKCGISKTLSSKSFICSSHFSKEDYIPTNGSRKLLKRIAVPSVIPEIYNPELPQQTARSKFIPSILKRRRKQSEPAVLVTKEREKSMDGCDQAQQNLSDQGKHGVSEDDEPMEHFQDLQESDYSSHGENVQPSVEEPASVTEDLPEDLDQNYEHDHFHDPHLGDDVNDGGDEDDPTFGYDEAIGELEDAVADIEIEVGDEISVDDVDIVRERGRELQQNVNRERLTLLDLIRNDEDLTAFTGIKTKMLDNLCKIVSKCEGDLYGKKFALSARARIVMCLCKLRLNLSFRCLAVLFGLNRKSSSSNVSYMIQLLSAIMDQFIFFPTREQCNRSLPKCFSKFSKTRIVLDCTEIPVEKPHCLQCRLKWYSHYKGCETIKLLVGMDPCGVISYISDSYGGRISDKEIFKQSGLLDRLDPGRDAIMVDKGFDIEIECLEAHIGLIIPPKLGSRSQLSPEDSLLTNEIATARVHVERVIQRMKLWKIMKDKVTLTTLPYFDDIVKIIAALVNLKSPLLANDKF
ncbi:hypothetical protein QAD02_014384 [Eretmocerus hayati]|uniref:Uncharacterized protein n=1 Tax=Eretmocerus hayati TaxID=131215 RepID=A0ACC2P803_9HYME|nr:hypothetical protein QAD02_014384 [Eretmocerus hayati]